MSRLVEGIAPLRPAVRPRPRSGAVHRADQSWRLPRARRSDPGHGRRVRILLGPGSAAQDLV